MSHAAGEVDTSRWPEQTYAVRSRIDFPRMKDLFWAHDRFTLTGTGEFAGTYHLFKGGRELSGRFASLAMRLNDWRFAGMEGSLVWTRDRFEVMKTRSGFYGGKLVIDFSMKPLGDPARPGIARLETAYEDVDVATVMEARAFAGLRLEGRATGRNLLTWPLGRFHEHSGDGEIRVAAAAPLQDRTLPSAPEPGGEASLARAFSLLPPVMNAKASRSRRRVSRRRSRSCSRRRSAAPCATPTVPNGSPSRPAGSRRRRPTSSCRARLRGAIDRRCRST